ncbi:MAG: type II toxin-antitoxin system RelE/ParE family toxin [Thermoplasmata archaeon]
MTKFEILVSETARRQIEDLPENLRKRVKSALSVLSEDPYRPRPKADIKKLRGPTKNYFRLRIGEYRAIYVIEGNRVLVAKVLLRSKAYDWIE